MLAAVTLSDDLTLGLKGTADVTAKTAVGNVPISGIPFNVQSGLKGTYEYMRNFSNDFKQTLS